MEDAHLVHVAHSNFMQVKGASIAEAETTTFVSAFFPSQRERSNDNGNQRYRYGYYSIIKPNQERKQKRLTSAVC